MKKKEAASNAREKISWKEKSKVQGDFRFDVINMIALTILMLIFFYPMYLCLISAISSPEEVFAGRVLLIPKGFNAEGFQRVLQNDSLWRGYLNSICYTILGTAINLALTMTGAFVLSRKTVWALVLPGAISTWNLIITRTFISSSIPDELQEAAQIDGCNNARFFVSIVLPNSSTIIAVIGLFYAVDHWLSYWNAMLYITKSEMYPLQLVLRDILLKAEVALQNAQSGADLDGGASIVELLRISESVKYIVVIAGTLPLLIVFPFVEKYFVKGVMIGSVKG